MAKEEAAKGPDNNKRLASLETQVSGLSAMLLALPGFAFVDKEEPIAAAMRVIDERGERIAEFQLDQEQLEAVVSGFADEGENAGETLTRILAELEDLRKADGGAKGVTPGELSAIERAETAEKALAKALVDLEASKKTVAELSADPTARPVARSGAKARKIDTKASGEAAALHVLMAEGGSFEVVLTAGGGEILEFDPVEYTTAAFHYAVGAFQLLEPLSVRGTASELTVDGAALFFGGEQVAYTAFPAAVKVPPYTERRFERSILFPAALPARGLAAAK